MSWTNFFTKIFVINLPERTDRLLEVAEELYKWKIPYELVNAIKHESGAEGLRMTVEKIFREAIANEWESVLIFEDDAMFVDSCGNPNDTMNEVVKQLPLNWDILYLGAQCTTGFKLRKSANLLLVENAFATHAWAISLHGMKEILMAGLEAPIDNCIVAKIQSHGTTYITYPLLATQRPGMSDIGNTYINWQPFIENRYYQKLGEL
jgi:GR25 family glycosyltransferase involved in LPS biosynthesis